MIASTNAPNICISSTLVFQFLASRSYKLVESKNISEKTQRAENPRSDTDLGSHWLSF